MKLFGFLRIIFERQGPEKGTYLFFLNLFPPIFLLQAAKITGFRKKSIDDTSLALSTSTPWWLVGWMFINYLCLRDRAMVVLSETLTFSHLTTLQRILQSSERRGVLTSWMIWRTEIPLSCIINPHTRMDTHNTYTHMDTYTHGNTTESAKGKENG